MKGGSYVLPETEDARRTQVLLQRRTRSHFTELRTALSAHARRGRKLEQVETVFRGKAVQNLMHIQWVG